jgi:hypothetical protein
MYHFFSVKNIKKLTIHPSYAAAIQSVAATRQGTVYVRMECVGYLSLQPASVDTTNGKSLVPREQVDGLHRKDKVWCVAVSSTTDNNMNKLRDDEQVASMTTSVRIYWQYACIT